MLVTVGGATTFTASSLMSPLLSLTVILLSILFFFLGDLIFKEFFNIDLTCCYESTPLGLGNKLFF